MTAASGSLILEIPQHVDPRLAVEPEIQQHHLRRHSVVRVECSLPGRGFDHVVAPLGQEVTQGFPLRALVVDYEEAFAWHAS